MGVDTELLGNVVDAQRPTLPKSFIYGLRACLEAGMTCEQITATLLIVGGSRGITTEFVGDELVRRTAEILRVMKGLQDLKEC